LLIYFLLNRFHFKYSLELLSIFSLIYYAYWKFSYLYIIILSIIINYIIFKLLIKKKNIKKLLIIIGITGNLSVLIYFKYIDFIFQNINQYFGKNLSYLNVVLPLAISFFTFQQIAFLVDTYKGKINQCNFKKYLLFITFFPQLIAGPIVHHGEIIPQYDNKLNKIINYENLLRGIIIFSIGLFKKVFIADNLSVIVAQGFDGGMTLNIIEAWITSLSYTFQLYFDFCGYTDMAIGIALMFNIKLPNNFNSPYKSLNVQDFWRRWHMTLSRFLRDYIYIPLGGSKNGCSIQIFSVIVTFLIGGIWHGAGWNFIIWGLLHGCSLSLYLLWKKFNLRLNSLLSWFLTFNFLNMTWVFFRSESLDNAFSILQSMIGLNAIILPEYFRNIIPNMRFKNLIFSDVFENINTDKTILIYIVILLISVLFLKNSNEFQKCYIKKEHIILASIFFTLSILNMHNISEFLYYNF
jgi:D-alanyl-lipoteichoic acid acyltransferase DltB (MBOAT superfamily)